MTSTLLTLTLAASATAVPIYEGRVVDPAAPAATVYTYERRVAADADGLTASHLTHDSTGALLIDETVQMSSAYALRRFDADNRQQHYRGSATLSADGRRLDFELAHDGKASSHASEAVSNPVVAGPSLHGFILQHWERLLAGDAIDVRMIVMAKMTTYGFRIRVHSRDEQRTAFSVTPTNWLVRFAVAPLTVAFDSTSRHVLRYDGRVPPLRIVDGRAREFDARVDYTMKTAAYR